MLSCNDLWFDKPPDQDHAAAQLRALSGKTHTLWTAVCVLRDGSRLWHHNAAARLTMRSLSDSFIEAYLAAAGPEVTASVRSEEHTSELQSLMRISYAVFCLKKKTHRKHHHY